MSADNPNYSFTKNVLNTYIQYEIIELGSEGNRLIKWKSLPSSLVEEPG